MASASFLKLNELVVDKAMYILLVVGWKFTNRTDAYGFLAIFDLTLVWVLCYFVFPCSPNLRKVGGAGRLPTTRRVKFALNVSPSRYFYQLSRAPTELNLHAFSA